MAVIQRPQPALAINAYGQHIAETIRVALRMLERGRWPGPGPVSLYTSDAADEEDSVDRGGRRIIKKKD